ncbi:MAG: hypothetical protein HQM16_17310 [Deltaproteobacteria bacterium]|nr:hypothetical protein [Deltaproteobacteria bacterium]
MASHTTVCGSDHSSVVDYNQYETRVLDIISHVRDNPAHRHLVMKDFSILKNLFTLDVPLSVRPDLFKELNQLISNYMITHRRDRRMFQVCYDMMTAFKNQIDLKPQTDEAQGELEWQELTCLAYMLSDWDDMSVEQPLALSPEP